METLATHFMPGATGLLAPLQSLLDKNDVSEILINKPGEVFVEQQGHMERIEMKILDMQHLRRLFTLIANENGQMLNGDSPILSGNLQDGSRVQLVIPPASKFYILSIRRASIKKQTLDDYRHSNFYSHAKPFDMRASGERDLAAEEQELRRLYQAGLWADFIALAVRLKKNIVISGETSSGKTTFLNACAAHIPAHERLITLEDTYEIDIPHQNRVALLAPKGLEGQKLKLSMQDLVQCALRLRPDRILMGETRGREVLDLISACSTGHAGSITTIHAPNPRVAFMRMTQMYKLNNVPSMRDEDIHRELHEVIDIVVQLKKMANGRQMTDVYYKGISHE